MQAKKIHKPKVNDFNFAMDSAYQITDGMVNSICRDAVREYFKHTEFRACIWDGRTIEISDENLDRLIDFDLEKLLIDFAEMADDWPSGRPRFKKILLKCLKELEKQESK